MRQFIKRALQKINDMDKRKAGDFIIAASREIDRLETVLHSLPRGILVCDSAHNIIMSNKAARRFLSIVSYEQGKEHVWAVIPEPDVAEYLSSTLLSGSDSEEKEFVIDVNNTDRILNISIMPLVNERQVSGSLILVDDITEKRSWEVRMRRMENLASLTTLAAGVAHEIKNPLAALSLHVQLIKKTMDANRALYDLFPPGLSPENPDAGNDVVAHNGKPAEYFGLVDKYLNVVNEEIERLNSIVVDFLFAVRPMNAELRSGNINELIANLAEFVSLELKEAGIKCVLNLADDLPEVSFDERLMKQALLNLIKNAEVAMAGGGELSLTTEWCEGEARIVIGDTGTGIPEENISKIFEPYFTTKATGSGLGLTMVFKIVKEHQGEISVNSRIGEGTVFLITLPAVRSDRRLITYRGAEAIPETEISTEITK